MNVKSETIRVESRGNGDIIDLSGELKRVLRQSGLSDGVATLFVPGSTAALTTIEYEPGALADFQRLFEEVAAGDRDYRHHLAWGCDNGHSHVRAALLGPSLSIPFQGGEATLGTWQQVILVDFDTRPRQREIIAQLIGE